MAGRKTTKQDIVQIDVDWLLGESADRPFTGSAWYIRSVGLLCCILVVVWGWPLVSKQWLQWDWQRQLAQSENKASDDVLPVLVALNDLNPQHNESIVQQLASADPEKRLIAYHLLQKRLERWDGSNRPSTSELNSFAHGLMSMQLGAPESVMLRGKLAARLLRLIGNDFPNASKVRRNLESMIAISGIEQPATLVESVIAHPPNQAETRATKVRIGDLAHADAHLVPDPPSLGPIQPTLTQSALVQSVPPARSQTLPDSPSVPFRTSFVSRPSLSTPPSSISTQFRTPSGYPLSHAPSPITTAVDQPQATIRGIDTISFDQLLPLLSSAQPKIVQEASKELIHRGMNKQQLEISLELAQGDVEQRLVAMDQLVRDPNLDPIPWLVWMAEHADSRVRRKAVALLGSMSMSNSDVTRKLRMLKSREPDSVIADQINQVLLAPGTAAKSFR